MLQTEDIADASLWFDEALEAFSVFMKTIHIREYVPPVSFVYRREWQIAVNSRVYQDTFREYILFRQTPSWLFHKNNHRKTRFILSLFNSCVWP